MGGTGPRHRGKRKREDLKVSRKIQLALALGAVFAVVAVGTASSGEFEDSSVSVQAPAGELPQCADLTDNDRDGVLDLEDKDCRDALDRMEGKDPKADKPGVKPSSAKPKPGKGPNGGLFGELGPGSDKGEKLTREEKHRIEGKHPRRANGAPNPKDPNATIAPWGAAPIGVPNIVIDQFEIPPFLLPIYQACGTEYGVPWQILAAINKIETGFGTNLNVSSAGATGWMQFMPGTWQAYGVDANEDGRKDPYNPVDAICAAGRYLKAAGAGDDLRGAIFAYNHADWYVDEVLLYANQYRRLPDDLIGSLTGLTEGAHFPVAADTSYTDDISEREALRRSKTNRIRPGNSADLVSSSPTRRGINLYSRADAPVVAVNDGVIREIGRSKRLGKYIVLQDAYGNRYTYADLGSVAATYPAPRERFGATGKDESESDPQPRDAASAGKNSGRKAEPAGSELKATKRREAREIERQLTEDEATQIASDLLGEGKEATAPGVSDSALRDYFGAIMRFDRRTMVIKRLRVGSQVTGGTVLGRVGDTASAHIHFAIQPAGRGAPKIDPKPILDGWKLLESTAIYRATGKTPFGNNASVGQILLMSKTMLSRKVLANQKIDIYGCGELDIRSGQINRRILAALEYLTERGYRLTISSLKCDHSYYTSSGNVSAHSSGNAVDIAAINGIPVLGHQGKGSITEMVVRDLMKLQGAMAADQIITLMNLGGPTFAMADHDDHIHLGYSRPYSDGQLARLAQVLKPEQWKRLIDRIGEIDNPEVTSRAKIRAKAARRAAQRAARRAGRKHRRAKLGHAGD